MPYITEKRRRELPRNSAEPANAGELNYIFTEVAIDYMLRKGVNYQHINDVVGALEGAKAEFQRRLVSEYENRKIKENGDLYDWDQR